MSTKEVVIHDSIADVDYNQWNNVVSQSEMGSVFQRVEWLRAIETGMEATPKHAVLKQDETVVGVFPNFEMEIDLPDKLSQLSWLAPSRVVSVGSGFGGPVTASIDTSVLDPLFNGLEIAVDDGAAYHQLNFLAPAYLGYTTYLENRGYVPSVKSCRFVVNLNRDFEKLKQNMSKDRRYNLRKAQEQEFHVTDEDVNASTIAEFYRKYASQMRRIDAEPLARSFFEELVQFDDRVKIFSLSVDGLPVGKHLYVLDDEQGAVHHYVSAIEESDFEYYPSELLHTHAIQWGQNRGYDRYDFGETPTDFSDGLFTYKKQFGGEPVPTLAWQGGLSTGKWYLFRLARLLSRTESIPRVLKSLSR